MKTDWFHQMNLNPALREMAARGRKSFVKTRKSTWNGPGSNTTKSAKTNRFIKIAQLSSNVGMAVFAKHLKASFDSLSVQTASTQQVRGLRLASMTRTAKMIGSETPTRRRTLSFHPARSKCFGPIGL